MCYEDNFFSTHHSRSKYENITRKFHRGVVGDVSATKNDTRGRHLKFFSLSQRILDVLTCTPPYTKVQTFVKWCFTKYLNKILCEYDSLSYWYDPKRQIHPFCQFWAILRWIWPNTSNEIHQCLSIVSFFVSRSWMVDIILGHGTLSKPSYVL